MDDVALLIYRGLTFVVKKCCALRRVDIDIIPGVGRYRYRN